jgi:hypothetical protein
LKPLLSLISFKLDLDSMVVLVPHFPVWLENTVQRVTEFESCTRIARCFRSFHSCIAALNKKQIKNFVIQYCNGIVGASDIRQHYRAILTKNMKRRRFGISCHCIHLEYSVAQHNSKGLCAFTPALGALAPMVPGKTLAVFAQACLRAGLEL